VDRNAITAAEWHRVGLGAQVSAVDWAPSKPNQMTGPQATPMPPVEHSPRACREDGITTGESRHSGRQRTKLALLTWAGAYAVIMLVLAIGGPAMASWPLPLRALVLSGLMVAAMTWVIVPVSTRLLRG
jgi:hypothetical protein